MSREYAPSLTPVQLHELICDMTQKITQNVAHIDLTPCDMEPDPHRSLCSVYTTLSGGYSACLVLCAERTFLHRLTENILGHPTDDPEDLEEYAKEYFNVLCGRLVGEIYQVTGLGAKFHPPCLQDGHYSRSPSAPDVRLQPICFTNSKSEHLMVLHSGFY